MHNTRHHPTAQFVATDAEKNRLVHRRHAEPPPARHHPPAGVSVLLAATDGTRRRTAYSSGKLFRFLRPHLGNDYIHLHVKVHAGRVD